MRRLAQIPVVSAQAAAAVVAAACGTTSESVAIPGGVGFADIDESAGAGDAATTTMVHPGGVTAVVVDETNAVVDG